MTILVALDPGTRISGLSIFRDRKLVHAQRVKVNAKLMLHARINAMVLALDAAVDERGLLFDFHFIAEWPQVYGGPRREDPNDLLPLAAVIQGFRTRQGALVSSESYVSPADWKGQRPKAVIMKHIFAKLSDDEKKAVVDPKDDNCVESAGVGLHALSRM